MEHRTKLLEIPYLRSSIYEGTCSCGYYTGKCLNEAEAKFRLDRHKNTTSPST